ncbi:hypothetical protein DAEQUDRAFT_810821 [Daedalea quercina L-15889]|uniref:Uncharacterized protein n=1 Tax=Daedalea quercina L-15889 TaxID=1314783 RepID=A0A165QY34_9APHY|nr:hypothetical protein DAEQUDRAFT_810821 [Daedalea quercina L-15889]
MLSFTLVLSAIVYAHYASALTSLFIPGFDPQPVTANLLGSQDSVTSYVIAPGDASAGMDDYGFDGPATLVVGPNTAAVTYIDENIGIALYENCNVANGVAVCEDVVIEMGSEGTTATTTVTEPVSSFAVQGGGAVTGAAAITTSPVPTGDFATWTLDLGDFSTDTDDDGFPEATDSSQNSAITSAPTASSSVGASRSGMSKVPASSGASGSSSSSAGDAKQTNTSSGAARFPVSGLTTVAVAGFVGALVVLA